MADVNTAIYQPLQAPQQQLGPLQVLQMIGQLNANKLFQQEFDSRQAIGDAYKASNGPNGLDAQKLRSLLPNVGYHAPEAVASGIANESASTDLDSKYQQAASQVIGELSTHKTITPVDISQAKQRLAAMRVPGGAITSIFSSAPTDPKELKAWAATHANLAKGIGETTQLVPGAVNEQTGVRPLQPAGQVLRQAVTGEGVNPALPLGEQEKRMASQNTAIALRERNAHYAEDMVPINGFLDAVEALPPKSTGPGQEELNKLKTALYPFSDWVPGLDKALGDPENMANFTKGQKYATQLASQVANNIGPHTNQGLTTAFSASPNMSMTQLAAKDLGKVLYGLRNMQQVMMLQAKKENVPDTNLLNWASEDWSTRVNPAGFMWDRLDDTEKGRVLHKIETIKDPYRRSAEMKKLRNSVEMGIQSGIIAGPPQEQQQ